MWANGFTRDHRGMSRSRLHSSSFFSKSVGEVRSGPEGLRVLFTRCSRGRRQLQDAMGLHRFGWARVIGEGFGFGKGRDSGLTKHVSQTDRASMRRRRDEDDMPTTTPIQLVYSMKPPKHGVYLRSTRPPQHVAHPQRPHWARSTSRERRPSHDHTGLPPASAGPNPTICSVGSGRISNS